MSNLQRSGDELGKEGDDFIAQASITISEGIYQIFSLNCIVYSDLIGTISKVQIRYWIMYKQFIISLKS